MWEVLHGDINWFLTKFLASFYRYLQGRKKGELKECVKSTKTMSLANTLAAVQVA
jgi:hypothetical protein